MIFPEPRKDRLHQQGVAFISTLVFAVLGFVFLSISQLEIGKTSREVFRRIDMTNLMPQSLRLGQVSSLEGSNVQLIAESRERDFDPVAEDGGASINESTANDTDGEDEESSSGNMQAANQESRPSRQLPVQQPSMQNSVEEPRPQVSGLMQQNNSSTSPDENGSRSGAGIPKLPLDAFGRDYKNLDVRDIIGWMKNNPSELPKGVRQLVRYRPAFLSSVATFEMEGRQYELYLMCKESLFEVHVVLVEQNEATYLVDRSFQKLSTYLRKGQVRRTQDNQIIAVRSNMATNDSSDEFYSLFLSWWEWAQQNQGV